MAQLGQELYDFYTSDVIHDTVSEMRKWDERHSVQEIVTSKRRTLIFVTDNRQNYKKNDLSKM